MQIFGDAQANPEFKGMGTTVTLMVESDGLIYIAHVGDSRIYINTDRELFRITKDHSFVQNLVDAGQLTDAEMETHPRKNELTKALGIGIDVNIEVAPKPIRAKVGDKFLLCSDGLCGLVNDATISSTVNAYSNLEATVDELIKLANNAGGTDNISVDLIEVIESDFVKTSFIDKNNVSNSITGTQEVNIPTDLPKPKINKKLILLGASLSLFSIILLFIFFKPPPPPPKLEKPEILDEIAVGDSVIKVKIDWSKEFKLLKKDEFISVLDGDSIFYSFTIKSTSKTFTDAINKSRKYKELSKSKARHKQQFFIANDNKIYTAAEFRKIYAVPGFQMAEGSCVFILFEDLELAQQDGLTSSLISIDLNVIKNELKEHRKTIQDAKKITYTFIGYKVSSKHSVEDCKSANKEGTCKVKFKITHKETGEVISGSFKHKYKISKDLQYKFNDLKSKITDRESYNLLPEQDQQYVVMDPRIEAKCESQNVTASFTIKVESQKKKKINFQENIEGDKDICYKKEVEKLKKTHRDKPLAYDMDNQLGINITIDIRGNKWFKNDKNKIVDEINVFDLELKYLKELDFKEKYVNNGYIENPSNSSSGNTVWFFATKDKQKNKEELNENNPFLRKELKFLKKYLKSDFKDNIRLIPKPE